MTLSDMMAVSANDNRQVTVKDETGSTISKFFDQYYISLNETILGYTVTSFSLNAQNGLEITVNTTGSSPDPELGGV